MTDRDMLILWLVARYVLVTPKVLHALFFGDSTLKAVERVLTRLLADDLLRSQQLIGPQCCYTLTSKAARLLGLDEKRHALPLGPSSVIKNYAILLFCLGGERKHQRMTLDEFRTRFRNLVVRGFDHSRYFLDDHSRLSLLIPDFGSDWRRLTRKVRKEADRRKDLPGWKDFFANKLFSITLLATSAAKAARLTKALSTEAYPVVVVALPELAGFLGQDSKGGRDT